VEAGLPTIWAVGILCAIVGAVPVAMARQSAPYAIIYPILFGGLAAVVIALIRRQGESMPKETIHRHLEAFTPQFSNFANLQEIAVVELTVSGGGKKSALNAQMDFGFEFEQKRSSKEKFRIFRTDEGTQLIALDCDRFSAMLTAETLESFDRSFEKSLEATLLRFSNSTIPKEHLFAITNEMARDILKSDIRGNLATYLSKTNDHLFRRVIDELRKASTKKEINVGGRKLSTRGAAE
jgi:hypothetical protein